MCPCSDKGIILGNKFEDMPNDGHKKGKGHVLPGEILIAQIATTNNKVSPRSNQQRLTKDALCLIYCGPVSYRVIKCNCYFLFISDGH